MSSWAEKFGDRKIEDVYNQNTTLASALIDLKEKLEEIRTGHMGASFSPEEISAVLIAVAPQIAANIYNYQSKEVNQGTSR